MFTEATREQLKLRMALDGLSGSGKTYTAMRAAFALVAPGKTVGVIDTEHKAASKYVGASPDGFPWKFKVCELQHFAPSNYVMAIQAAADAGYDVLVIDSLSHAWDGLGGALDQIDKKSSSGGNSYTAWKDVTPQHRELIEAILAAPMHIIATMRTKVEYVLEEQTNAKGKTVMVPRKVGMKTVQREGMDYEFDVVIDIDSEHHASVSKTRCSTMDGRNAVRPGPEFFAPLIKWLDEGEPPKPKFTPATPEATIAPPPPDSHSSGTTSADAMTDVIRSTAEQRQEMATLAKSLGMPPAALKAAVAKRGAATAADLTLSQANEIITSLRSKLAIKESSMTGNGIDPSENDNVNNPIPF